MSGSILLPYGRALYHLEEFGAQFQNIDQVVNESLKNILLQILFAPFNGNKLKSTDIYIYVWVYICIYIYNESIYTYTYIYTHIYFKKY